MKGDLEKRISFRILQYNKKEKTMKKTILTIGVLGLLCSCSSNKDICVDEVNKLNNTILELENKISKLEIEVTAYSDSLNTSNYILDRMYDAAERIATEEIDPTGGNY